MSTRSATLKSLPSGDVGGAGSQGAGAAAKVAAAQLGCCCSSSLIGSGGVRDAMHGPSPLKRCSVVAGCTPTAIAGGGHEWKTSNKVWEIGAETLSARRTSRDVPNI